MKGPWVKLWRKMLADEKLAVLMEDHGDKAFRVWVTLLARADEGSVTENRRVLASVCGAKLPQLEGILADMADLGMIVTDADKITILKWGMYQDSESKPRVKRFRERLKPVTDPLPSPAEPVTDPLHARYGYAPVTTRGIEDRGIEGEGEGEGEHTQDAREGISESPEEPRGPEPFPEAPPTSGYPQRLFAAWEALGERVYQPAGLIQFLNTYSRDISPHTAGHHSSDVLQAIANFGLIVGQPGYYWTVRVGISKFLKDHLEKFLPKNFKPEDFRERDFGGGVDTVEDIERRMAARKAREGATA